MYRVSSLELGAQTQIGSNFVETRLKNKNKMAHARINMHVLVFKIMRNKGRSQRLENIKARKYAKWVLLYRNYFVFQ